VDRPQLAELDAVTPDLVQMDQLASALLDFPPAGGLPDDDQYHWAAKSHSQKVDKLSVSQNFKDAAAQLLDVGGLCL
jgi:hypothetical protein